MLRSTVWALAAHDKIYARALLPLTCTHYVRLMTLLNETMEAAKLLETRSHQLPGMPDCWLVLHSRLIRSPTPQGKLTVSELFFDIPLDYSNSKSGSLWVFARSVERFENLIL